MIDVEQEVFDAVSQMLNSKYPDIHIHNEMVSAPPSFPCVTIEEKDNAVNENTITGNREENYNDLLYEINVYSNLLSGKKDQCKSILTDVDQTMHTLGFTRTLFGSVLNEDDLSIYKMTSQYTATISKNKTIFKK